jgi:hypothetical protein
MNSHTSLNDARLDRAIDRAVREMMQVDPAPGLSRRVLSRINAPAEHRTFPALRYGFAAAALAVCLSITLLRVTWATHPPKAPRAILAGGVHRLIWKLLSTVTISPVSIQRVSTNLKRTDHMPRTTNVWRAATRRISGHGAMTVCYAFVPGRCAPDRALSARPIVIEPLVLGTPEKGGR